MNGKYKKGGEPAKARPLPPTADGYFAYKGGWCVRLRACGGSRLWKFFSRLLRVASPTLVLRAMRRRAAG